MTPINLIKTVTVGRIPPAQKNIITSQKLNPEELDGCECDEKGLCLIHLQGEERDFWEDCVLPSFMGG